MQKNFSNLEYASKKKLTRRDRFLAEIDTATPWHLGIEIYDALEMAEQTDA